MVLNYCFSPIWLKSQNAFSARLPAVLGLIVISPFEIKGKKNMKSIFLIASLILMTVSASAQINHRQSQSTDPIITEKMLMSSYDSLMLSKLPPLELSDDILRRSLPYMVDNSQLPYFGPLVSQVGLECGQAASIGIVFSYEMSAARDVPGDLPENQYATHFTYNFLNGGSNAGINYYETYEMIKRAGNPSVADYGGMSAGGPSRWMSGYDLYYNSMQNRISEVYSIKLNTIEGLETFKNWLYDHGKGSDAGGLASFYAQFGHPNAYLPEGTPEGGKHVFTSFGPSVNHAMAIVGYNDSIRYDYNGDGQYTNHIDINGDGIVDMRDWEIGGFKMANTYGNVNWWGDGGFSYMMYKTVADKVGEGGIWNHMVAVVDVRDYHQPLLTAKVNLTYPCRNRLKIMAGYADDPDAEDPDVILHFPIFDFQGGCLPMQGSANSETIEIGLDLNYLLAFATPGEAGKYFLMVQENDPGNDYNGMINSFSLMEYSDGNLNEINFGSSQPIQNNSITYLGIEAAIDFDPVNIVQEELPGVQLHQPYSVQLEAEGGTLPYRWSLADDYQLVDSTALMPSVVQNQLEFSDNNSGIAEVNLPFEFPFYGKTYNKVYATVDGYIRFDESLIPWPFYIDGKTYLLQNKMISPCMSHPFVVAPSQGDGVWYEATANYITFMWQLSMSGSTSGTSMEMAARMYKNGKIEFFYGNQWMPSWLRRYAGISAGDGENFVYLHPHSNFMPDEDDYYRLTPINNYTGLTLSKDGHLSGTIDGLIYEEPIRVCVTDKNNVRRFKTFELNSEGVFIDATVQSENNNQITFGDPFSLDITINNISIFPLTNAVMSITVNSPYYEIIESEVELPHIEAGSVIEVEDIFEILALNNITNNYNARFLLNLEADEGSWSRNVVLTAYAPVLSVHSIQINDGNNGFLEPGETAWIEIDMHNTGGADLREAEAVLTSSNPYLTIHTSEVQLDTLSANENWLIQFEVSLDESTPAMEWIGVNLDVQGHNEFGFSAHYPILTAPILEDFETGDFSTFAWFSGGEAEWFITTDEVYEGNYAARSGAIDDNEVSSLMLQYEVAFPDTISFYHKVSSEPDYDFLRFKINAVEQGNWTGETDWQQAKFHVDAGDQLFNWQYTKDQSVSQGEDCAWIDFIVLPPMAIPTGTAQANEALVENLHVYPNPFMNELNVEVNLRQPSKVQIYVMDASGRFIYAQENNNLYDSGEKHFSLNIPTHTAGVYFVIVRTHQQTLIRKVIRPGH